MGWVVADNGYGDWFDRGEILWSPGDTALGNVCIFSNKLKYSGGFNSEMATFHFPTQYEILQFLGPTARYHRNIISLFSG